MEAIAAAAGVTKPILYRGIGDREALVAALAERFVDRINAVVEAAVVGASGPHEALRRFASAYLGAVDTERNLYTFITSSPTGGRGDQALHLADRSVLQMAAQLGAQRQAQGLDPAAATPWAYAIVGMMHIVTLWWMRDATISREDLAEHLADLLWAGLRGEAPPIVP